MKVTPAKQVKMLRTRRPFNVAAFVAGSAILAIPVIASAHPGHADSGTGADGFLHPLTGADHILAMVAVGIWAAVSRGRAIWLMPVTFVTAMIFGALLGASGVQVPFVETGILLSVLVLGALLAFAIRPTLWISLPMISLFALFHGHAHGAEMPAGGSLLNYGVGFVLGTAMLHAIGIAGIVILRRARLGSGAVAAERFARVGGFGIVAAGILLCLGIL